MSNRKKVSDRKFYEIISVIEAISEEIEKSSDKRDIYNFLDLYPLIIKVIRKNAANENNLDYQFIKLYDAYIKNKDDIIIHSEASHNLALMTIDKKSSNDDNEIIAIALTATDNENILVYAVIQSKSMVNAFHFKIERVNLYG